MNQDNKNALVGMMLILFILLGWNYFMAPSKQDLANQQRIQDSVAQVQLRNDSLQKIQLAQNPIMPDSLKNAMMNGEFGLFAPFATGNEQIATLENDDIKVSFTNKGGRIKEVLLKHHFKIWEDANRVEHKEPLKLLEDSKNRFEYIIPTNTSKGKISTQDLYFTPSVSGNTIIFTAAVDGNTYLQQKYVLGGDYDLDYEVQLKGLGQVLNPNTKGVQLNFENYLDKLEKNFTYEVSYSYLRFRENDETPDYIATTGQASKELKSKPIQWIATANQFFNTAIISQNGGFSGAQLYNEAYDAQSADLKKMIARLDFPANNGEVSHKMKLFVGPNDYQLLKSYGLKLEDIVDYGGSILGTINRWLIRPIFDFLHGFVGNVAICILLLTFIVKAFLYPLSYKMIQSQAKTTALKPDIDKMKAKYKDDPQKVQMEQMKLYQEFGVNPLGGCLPTLLQMPIWMALFRFFPASIDFRQKGFLWATDLTGFEEFIKLPFHIPLYGGHISLFALLWGVSLVAFTWYSMKDMDMSGQPAAMKYIQYFTPVIFTVMFNSYAAGLSLYMLFSNILNIGQTVATKNYIIDHDKIRADLEAYKKKPKKQSLFRQKLNEAMQQSQALKEQQEKAKNKKK
jgi:YidC/Oxa1 family membrane protein insertase